MTRRRRCCPSRSCGSGRRDTTESPYHLTTSGTPDKVTTSAVRAELARHAKPLNIGGGRSGGEMGMPRSSEEWRSHVGMSCMALLPFRASFGIPSFSLPQFFFVCPSFRHVRQRFGLFFSLSCCVTFVATRHTVHCRVALIVLLHGYHTHYRCVLSCCDPQALTTKKDDPHTRTFPSHPAPIQLLPALS